MVKKMISGVVIGTMIGAAAGVYVGSMIDPAMVGKKARRMMRTGKRSVRRYARGMGIM